MNTKKHQDILETIKCPLCLSTKAKRLYSISSHEAAKHINTDKEEPLIPIIERLWGSESCWFYKCRECTFSFAWPFQSGSKEFYSTIYSNTKFYPKQKWDYIITHSSILKLSKSTKLKDIRLLEIGAGDGSFIKQISPSLIPPKNILCTEFSNYGKNKILQYGIECISIDLKDIDSQKYKHKFDIICMFQVLEHIDNFNAFFKKINEISNNNAHLFITTPNNNYREFYDSIDSKFDIPPIHVSRWNKKTFGLLGKKFKWQIKDYKVENPGFLKKLRKFLFNRYHYFNITNALDKIENKPISLIIKVFTFFVFLIIYFPKVIKLFSNNLGVAQWVHLQKK